MLEPKSQILLLNEHLFQYMYKPCMAVEQTRYCYKDKIQPVADNCIPNIILNKPTSCNFTKLQFVPEISYLEPEYLYVATQEELPFNSTCLQNQKSVKGINLIHFTNCVITINAVEYDNSINIYYDKVIFITPYNDINISNIDIQVNLPTLQNWTITNNKEIELLHVNNVTHTLHKNIISGTMIIIITLLGIYTAKACITKHRKKPALNINIPLQPIEDVKTSNDVHKHRLWPSLRGEKLRPTAPSQTTTSAAATSHINTAATSQINTAVT